MSCAAVVFLVAAAAAATIVPAAATALRGSIDDAVTTGALDAVPAVCMGNIIFTSESGNLTAYNLLKRTYAPFPLAPTSETVSRFALSGGSTIVYQLESCVA